MLVLMLVLIFTTGPASRYHIPTVTGQETEAWGQVNDSLQTHTRQVPVTSHPGLRLRSTPLILYQAAFACKTPFVTITLTELMIVAIPY